MQVSDVGRDRRPRGQIAAVPGRAGPADGDYVDARVALRRRARLHRPVRAQYRGMVAEVAIAKRVSATVAASFMDDSVAPDQALATTTKPCAREAGGSDAARAIAHATVVSTTRNRRAWPTSHRRGSDDLFAGKVPTDGRAAGTRDRPGRRDFGAPCASAPTGTVAVSPAGSGMRPCSVLPACRAATAAYTPSRREGTPRGRRRPTTTGHLMCDTLVERLTGADPATDPVPDQLVMTDATLFAPQRRPGPPGRRRTVAAAHTPVARHQRHAWLRRFLTDPVDGSLYPRRPAATPLRRHPPRLVIARDQHCHGIQCGSPDPRHRPRDGVRRRRTTTLDDGQGIDRACHTSRDDPRMQVQRRAATGVITWTTPSGLTWRALPPPNPIGGRTLQQQRRWRRQLLHPSESICEQHLVEVLAIELKHRHRQC